MTATIIDAKPLNEATIIDFERRSGIVLTVAYKKFLIKCNGAYPEPDCFTTIDQKEGSSNDRFLGLNVGEHSDLEEYLKAYLSRIPADFFPIAHEPGGNLILIDIGNQNKAIGVYFWDHEIESDGYDPDMSNISKIADSLDLFLEQLRELPEE